MGSSAAPHVLCAAALLFGACAAAPDSRPWMERAATAAAIELEGEWESPAGSATLRLRACAPAAGTLEIVRRFEIFGQVQETREAWIGDGTAIYALHAEQAEAAWHVARWSELEILADFPFLPPPWAPERPATSAVRTVTDAAGALLHAAGADENGAWSFRARAGRLHASARAEDYAVPPPAGYTVLGDPRNEFDHVRTLLEVGEFAPEITLIGLDGRERVLSEFRGRRLLLAFWFYH